MNKTYGVSFISSYIPRRCGIATFTNDLSASLNNIDSEDGFNVDITAVTDTADGYKYPLEVKFEIRDRNVKDFKEAAYYLNLSDADVVSIQHEFGLFGGEAGSHILYLIESLHKPLVTTLHTILENPLPEQLKVMKEICSRSAKIVVQSLRACRMLNEIYGAPQEKISYISHGAPNVPFLDPAYYKDKFGLTGKKVILTFGLLGPGKGIEDVLNSLPAVVENYSDIMYIILGATHPHVKKNSGESYRTNLENIVAKHGLENNVMLINRFVETNQLLEFLLMSDIYVSPYQVREQIVSGTLTYALACGKAIVSTPYWYAEELLDDERGILVPFKNREKMSEALTDLLIDENKRNRIRKKAYDAGRLKTWNNVAKIYSGVFRQAIEEHKVSYKRKFINSAKSISPLPEISFTHLKNITDDTGVLQHSVFSIPNPNYGYCTDDNVRALLATFMYYLNFNDEDICPLISKYMGFVYYAFNGETGLFRNFMSYERKWLDESGAEDCNGRVIFILGYLIKNSKNNSYLALAKNLFDNSIKNMTGFKSPRAISFVIMGCIFYLKKFSGARDIKRILKNFSAMLHSLYESNHNAGWKWYENILTYVNGRIPQAMLMSGGFLSNVQYTKTGLESIEWLYNVLIGKEDNYLSLIGNDGWYVKGKRKARYDQQPLEIPALIDALWQAYKISGDKKWIDRISISFSWFMGNNLKQEMICDVATGACYDGLTQHGVNQNQGAESTVSWLLSLLRMNRIQEELKMKPELN